MIGRTKEIDQLMRLYDSDESEFVAIYGRRRVGKTYLVRETFDGQFTFFHTGLLEKSTRLEISHFYKSLKEYGCSASRCPKDWFEAFDLLRDVISASKQARKIVFIDELPWMDTTRSNFVTALESFWNEWASARKDVLFIVCGSASAWMVKKLFRNRGALHNRVTARILLQPFSLGECELYMRSRGMEMTRKDIAECYMAIGGIPFYWRQLDRASSLAQNMDRIFFEEDAPLKGEFKELFHSLFQNAPLYIKIASALAKKKCGLQRQEIATLANIGDGLTLTDALETLAESGFIRIYRAFGKKKRDAVYQLIDNFTLFHFRFLDGNTTDSHSWTATLASPMQSAWRGLAFERLCLHHLDAIKKALGIWGIHTEAFSWRHAPNDVYPTGTQIDLLLDRADNVINLCEMKYSQGPFAIDAETAQNLSAKAETFRSVTKSRKAIHLTMVTSSGLVKNAYRNQIQAEISLDDLFAM